MIKHLMILSLLMGFHFSVSAQIPYNGPQSLTPNSTNQYSRVSLPTGVTVSWSISGAGASIIPPTAGEFVYYDVATSPITLTANFSNGTSANYFIPVYQPGDPLVEGEVPLAIGTHQHPIYQLLRGERFTITSQVANGEPKPTMKLVDFQGRFITEGESIDFRAPVRGSYFLVVTSTISGILNVEGIRPYIPAEARTGSSALTQPSANSARLDAEIERTVNLSGGESMVTLGDVIISAVYDYNIKKTVVKAYENDAVIWSWTSNENEYLRTITADAVHGIAGVGSSDGALKADDNVLQIRLSTSGIFQNRTSFGTADGIDYGYGISFLTDGSTIVSGFTSGEFESLVSAGGLDAFAFHLSADGAVLNKLQFGTEEDDRIFASRTLSNGNVVLFGDTDGLISDTGSAAGSGDIFLTEITPTCTKVWTKQYGSDENDLAFDLVIEPTSGDFLLTGMTTGELVTGFGNPEKPQVYAARINKTSRNITWLKQLGPTEGQSGETIALSAEGVGILFYTNGSFEGAFNNSLGAQSSDDMAIAHFDFDGNLQWLYQFDDTSERIFARALTFQGNNVFVLRDHAYEPNKPFATTSLDRFSFPVITASYETAMPEGTGLSAFPNPTQTTFSVHLNNQPSSQVVDVLDLYGTRILQSINSNEINLSAFPTGVYFVHMSIDNKTFVQKILKQ